MIEAMSDVECIQFNTLNYLNNLFNSLILTPLSLSKPLLPILNCWENFDVFRRKHPKKSVVDIADTLDQLNFYSNVYPCW